MQSQFPFNRRLLPVCIAAAIAGMSPVVAQALPLHAEASYTVNGTTTNLPNQDSSTNVDILEFPTVDNVNVGLHTYGTLGSNFTQFGDRASATISGPGSYDVQGIFQLALNNVAGSNTFNVISGEVSAIGAAGGFLNNGDFVHGLFSFDLVLDGSQIYHQDIAATVDDTGASATATTTVGSGLGIDLGVSCNSDTATGFASCGIGGGPFTLNFDDLNPTNFGDHTLLYTLTAVADGSVTDTNSCGTGIGDGSGIGVAFAAVIGDGSGGGFSSCSSVARSGDPSGVPEPGTMSLAALGMAALQLARRRRAGKPA